MTIKERQYVANSYPLKLTKQNDDFIDVMCWQSSVFSRNHVINVLIEKGIESLARSGHELNSIASEQEVKTEPRSAESWIQFKRWFKVD